MANLDLNWKGGYTIYVLTALLKNNKQKKAGESSRKKQPKKSRVYGKNRSSCWS